MGKVFRSEEIWERKYPKPGDQIDAARDFMEQVPDLPHLHSAIVYGSTATGNPGRRSDIDVALAYDADDTHEITTFHLALKDMLLYMPQGHLIEPHIVSRQSLEDPDQAQKGDVLLTEHLRLMATESVVPGINPDAFAEMTDPLRRFSIDQAAELAQQVTEAYLLQKQRKFFNAALTSELSHAKLQRAFELPTAITRKLARVQALRSKSKFSPFSTEFYARDSLALVSLRDFTSTGEWHESASWLIDHDKEYSALLEAVIRGDTSLQAYDEWLTNISRSSYEQAIQLSIAGLAISQSLK